MFARFQYLHKLRVEKLLRKMSSLSFVQKLNPINNKMEWKAVRDDYDYNFEIATSCYGDMLHDEERNKKFGEALKKAIDQIHSEGKKAHVLDIGTGTGLLSMLAIRYGADSVVACEAFEPMANCAANVLKENNFSDKIKIVKCHSKDLKVGEKGDLKEKANILVSEVFDTELIGEGAIRTFNHAFEELLVENCIVIPSSGIVYAQVVESDVAQKWNKLEEWKSDDLLIKIPEEIKKCPGAAAVHDIQLSEFSPKNFKLISEVLPIFHFEWARNKKIPVKRQSKFICKAVSSGKAQVVFFWWKLILDQEGEITINCAPVWEHPETKGLNEDIKTLSKMLPWRDHWMQAVYFFSEETVLKKNDLFTLISNHDEFSFWFNISDTSETRNLDMSRPVCHCSFHFLLSRTRIGAMNDERRRNKYYQSLKTVIKYNTICVVLSDISLLAVLSAALGAKKVYVLCETSSVEQVFKNLIRENKLAHKVFLRSNLEQIIDCLNLETVDENSDFLILSEPYFRNSILPWDVLSLWYMKEKIVGNLEKSKINNIKMFPKKCRLQCCGVQFDNLWKIATPLNFCEGFSMKVFDNLIGNAKERAENYAETQPLWEYPGIALTLPLTLFEFDLNEYIPKKKIKNFGKLIFESPGRCDGIAFWMEYDLIDNFTLSFGPVKPVTVSKYILWDMFERQGVHLFRKQLKVISKDSMDFEVEFDPEEADFLFNFHWCD